MKKLLLLAAALFAFVLAGCSVITPLQMTVNESYLTHPDAYTVLGQVEGTSSCAVLFGIFMTASNNGYAAAMEDAVRKSGADGLINCVADVQYRNFLIGHSITTKVRGLAIKKK